MDIKGIGTDMVFVPRIQGLYQRFGERFAKRILTPKELARVQDLHDPVPFLAKRFAAKEALSKALGTGIGKEVGFHDIAIVNDAKGKPVVEWSSKGQAFIQSLRVKHAHISLSDEQDYALAFVVLN